MNKSIVTSILIVVLSFACFANDNTTLLFETTFSVKAEKVKGGKIRGQKLKGRYDGMGVIRFNNHDIYFGDVQDGKPNGKGIYICAPDNNLKYCDSCVVYIGRFNQGMKSKGICLNEDSDVIYDGKFSSEKPVSTYPSNTDTDYCGYFGEISPSDEGWIYVGEISQETPNGLGILLFKNNDFLISNFRDGVRDGIGLLVSANGEWQTEKAKEGRINIISSSEYYSSIDAERKRQVNAHLSEALGYFSQALQSGTQLVSMASGNNYGNVASYSSDGTSDFSATSSSGNYQADYDKWAKRAEKHYDSITNLGYSATKKNGDKQGSAGQGMSGGNYVAMKKSFREAQKQMRSIRNKAKKAGVSITQSKWEAATISY